jgi:hypothetical protein
VFLGWIRVWSIAFVILRHHGQQLPGLRPLPQRRHHRISTTTTPFALAMTRSQPRSPCQQHHQRSSSAAGKTPPSIRRGKWGSTTEEDHPDVSAANRAGLHHRTCLPTPIWATTRVASSPIPTAPSHQPPTTACLLLATAPVRLIQRSSLGRAPIPHPKSITGKLTIRRARNSASTGIFTWREECSQLAVARQTFWSRTLPTP